MSLKYFLLPTHLYIYKKKVFLVTLENLGKAFSNLQKINKFPYSLIFLIEHALFKCKNDWSHCETIVIILLTFNRKGVKWKLNNVNMPFI